MKKMPFLVLASVALLGLPGAATAQGGQMMFVYQETVKPSMLPEYEAATKDFLKQMKGAQVDPSMFAFQTIATSEFQYLYVMPVDGFAGLGTMFEKFEGMMQQLGQDAVMKMQQSTAKTVTHGSNFAIMLRGDLSVNLEATEISASQPFRKYYWFHVIPGMEDQFEGVVKDYAKLYTSKQAGPGFRMYQVVMGPDLPLYLAVSSAEDEAAWAARDKMINQKLGYEMEQLWMRALKATQRLRVEEGMVRVDLSYPQPMGETGGSN